MFPELRPYLEDCFEMAEPGTEFVITRYRDANANLQTQLLRIIQRAGLKPWPKLFQNLQSTSPKRRKIRRSKVRKCLATARKRTRPRMKKPLFCRGARHLANTCKMVR